LYDFAPVGCVTTDAKGIINASNLVGSDMLGARRASLVSQPFSAFFCERQRPEIDTLMEMAKQSGEHQRCELTLLNAHAVCNRVQLDLTSLSHGNGFQMVLTDITVRKAIEDQLRGEAERCAFAMDAVGDCQWDWNMLTGAVSYSPQLTQLYGYSAEELGNSVDAWRALVHPDNQTCFIKGVQRCLSGQDRRFACEIQVMCKDGSYKWILCRGAVFNRTPDGQVHRLIGMHTDITLYKQRPAAAPGAGMT
jgi:PAS domain S-box-containing protein